MSGKSSSRHLAWELPLTDTSNLSWSTDDQALAQTFEQFGAIEKAVSILLHHEGT